jgi:chromosomal replication initiation ATPase DnaA
MIGIIEESVCKAYNITAHELRNGGSKRLYSSARAMTWYILHYHYNWSANAIAKEYDRSDRGIKQMISNVKFQLREKDILNKYNLIIDDVIKRE